MFDRLEYSGALFCVSQAIISRTQREQCIWDPDETWGMSVQTSPLTQKVPEELNGCTVMAKWENYENRNNRCKNRWGNLHLAVLHLNKKKNTIKHDRRDENKGNKIRNTHNRSKQN
jgi:hypothetical protein